MIRDIVYDDAARADDDIASDRHAGCDAAVSAEPDVAANRDGKRVFQHLVPQVGVDGMVRSIKTAARADEHIIAEGDLAGIQKDAVVIDEQIVSGLDVIAEADVNILLCADVFPDPVQDLTEDGLASCKVGRLHLIEFVAQIEAAEIVLIPAGKRCIIQQPELAFFSFGHITSRSQTAAPASGRRPCSRLRKCIPAG